MKELKKKGILLLLSLLMLVAAGAYLTFAWYTKVTSVSGMEFNAAQWEFTANFEVDDIKVNVYSYTTSNKGMAAPGTAGVIPILLGAKQSDTDVDFEIYLDKSTMSPEFRERIYFYTKETMKAEELFDSAATNTTGQQKIMGKIDANGETTVNIYWKWVYEYKDVPGADANDTAKSLAFDEFDTLVGKKPDLYEPYMSATLSIVGTQSSPMIADNAASQ